MILHGKPKEVVADVYDVGKAMGVKVNVDCVGTKGVSQNHLLSFDDNKVLKMVNWIC